MPPKHRTLAQIEASLQEANNRVHRIPLSQLELVKAEKYLWKFAEKVSPEKLAATFSAHPGIETDEGHFHTILRDCIDLVAIKAVVVLQKLHESAEFQEAKAAVLPLIDEIEALEAELNQARAIKASAEKALREAEQAARKQAEEAAALHPEVVAAKKRLEAV